MSYLTNFVHAQPIAEPTTAKATTTEKTKAVTRKDTTTKILLFVAIVTCVVLAVNI